MTSTVSVSGLHEAARSGNIDKVRDIIASGVDLELKDSSKRTALHLACWSGHTDIVRLLIQSKANVNAKALDQFTALHFISQKDNISIEIFKLLIRKDKSLLNYRISKGNKTALHLASSKNLINNVKILLELGADISAKTNQGQTALDLATNTEVRELIQSYTTGEISTKTSKSKRDKSNINTDDNHDGDDTADGVNNKRSLSTDDGEEEEATGAHSDKNNNKRISSDKAKHNKKSSTKRARHEQPSTDTETADADDEA